MGLWDRLMDLLTRYREADENTALKLARNALARAFDDEAERLNDGKPLGFGSTKKAVNRAAQEAQDLGSFVRKLDPRDPRIVEALRFQKEHLLDPLDDRAREVLSKPWPRGFDPEAKLAAAIKALHQSRKGE